jgi:uncharacterized protein (UPF0335 family)
MDGLSSMTHRTERHQQEIDTLHRDITDMQRLQSGDGFRFDRIARITRAYERLAELGYPVSCENMA